MITVMSFKQAMTQARKASTMDDNVHHVALVRDPVKARGFIGYTVTLTYDADVYLMSYQNGKEVML